MKQTQFWFIVVMLALFGTWLYLVIQINGDQKRMERIENHSEILSIDTAE